MSGLKEDLKNLPKNIKETLNSDVRIASDEEMKRYNGYMYGRYARPFVRNKLTKKSVLICVFLTIAAFLFRDYMPSPYQEIVLAVMLISCLIAWYA